MTFRFVLSSLLCVFLFLSPMRANAQNFSGTSSELVYDYFSGQNQLYCFTEFFYTNSGSGSYMWTAEAIRFTLTVVKYDSYAQYLAANPVSTSVTTHSCGTGEWMVQQWNPTTVRLSGAKYLTVLQEGYFYDITMAPKGYGSWRPSFYSQWQGIVWDGELKNAQVDLTNPGDGE